LTEVLKSIYLNLASNLCDGPEAIVTLIRAVEYVGRNVVECGVFMGCQCRGDGPRAAESADRRPRHLFGARGFLESGLMGTPCGERELLEHYRWGGRAVARLQSFYLGLRTR
jgi:hypothetical protein